MAPRLVRSVIAEAKQRWLVIRWMTKKLLYRTPPCLGRHIKPLGTAAFAFVSTYQTALDPRGVLWPFLLV
jgi:hypothetical protein